MWTMPQARTGDIGMGFLAWVWECEMTEAELTGEGKRSLGARMGPRNLGTQYLAPACPMPLA